jgi:hypothetical protein
VTGNAGGPNSWRAPNGKRRGGCHPNAAYFWLRMANTINFIPAARSGDLFSALVFIDVSSLGDTMNVSLASTSQESLSRVFRPRASESDDPFILKTAVETLRIRQLAGR